MTERYCDLGQDFDNPASVGDTSGNPALGPGGLQSMIEGWGNHDALVAGDILKLTGSGDLSKLVKITVDVDRSGTWTISDVVQNFNSGGGSSGDDWVGELVFIDATTVWVQINAASTDISVVSTADGIDNTTLGNQILGNNMLTAAAPGIQIDNNAGTADDPIQLLGVSSGWVETSTDRFVLDAKGLATNCILSDAKNLWVLRNFELDQADKDGISTTNVGDADSWFFLNGSIHDCGDHGIGRSPDNTEYIQQSFFVGVDFFNNTKNGTFTKLNHFRFCTFRNNTLIGNQAAPGANSYANCVFSGNGGPGVQVSTATTIDNCVFDGNGEDNVSVIGVTMIIATRITDANSAASPGIDADAALLNLYNFFDGNSVPHVDAEGLDLSIYKAVDTEITTGEVGYEDKAAGKYGLKIGAAGYRNTFLLPDDLSQAAFTIGLPTSILPKIGEK